MAKKIRVELPLGDIAESDQDFPERVKNLVKENESEFHERMARLAASQDMRAELVDESLEIDDISIGAGAGAGCLSVSFMYSAYYGCKDMDNSDYIEDNWGFSIENNHVVFDLELPPEREPDEF